MFDHQEYLADYVRVLMHLDYEAIEPVVEAVAAAWLANRTVFVCGNGGSAATACHIAADLTKLTAPPVGARLRAVALTESLAAISAIANDLAYEEIFSEQLRAFAQSGDVVIGLSTSGSSPNVLRAVAYANTIGAFTIGVTGRNGHKLQALARHTIMVDSTSVQHVEDATMVAGHILCLQVKCVLQRLQSQAPQRSVSGASVPSGVAISAAARGI
jgi:D-sedoheptulose 7-phosphate isomerase